ncbi:hypothetical protein [Actinacidiphila sp. ITFR-21]|uniref:hypothetical protein n=1 Tax=Actinacidiphila sp. ITFR-21 TaxID=3075199 RepID=UPI00288BFBF0|nr:hypothetical protein [Streptomyces sp. ITFR-21]WNI15235.1 hypothetical protein RLT57_06580 [Streptomyces sp. ITFR-21]
MSGPAVVRRPTEDAAVDKVTARRLSPARVADLLIVARATGDRYGALLFDKMLDRAMGDQA